MVWDAHRIRSDPPGPVSSTAARDPLATRAGGQDDGNYSALPQMMTILFHDVKHPRRLAFQSPGGTINGAMLDAVFCADDIIAFPEGTATLGKSCGISKRRETNTALD